MLAQPQSQAEDNGEWDPMIYDVMREKANMLGGWYVALEREAGNPAEAERWRDRHSQLIKDVEAVPAFNLAAVEAASAEISRQFELVRDL